VQPSPRKATVSSRGHPSAALNGHLGSGGSTLGQKTTATGGNAGSPADGRPAAGAKKPYAPPVLIRWGTLRQLTRTVGSQGKNDGGVPNYGRKTR